MEELLIEEKAKRYDEALHKAKNYYSTTDSSSDIKLIGLIFPELKESDDEKIRKALVEMVHDTTGDSLWIDYNVHKEDAIDWLEKQGGHANFRNAIQVGDKVTRNEDGVLVNLSQLNRVAKKDEKQGEQKSTEWSEEDENMINSIIRELIHQYNEEIPQGTEDKIKWLKNKLKSLRPKTTWKPSDAQMKAINHAIQVFAQSPYMNENDYLFNMFKGLKKDLEQLKAL